MKSFLDERPRIEAPRVPAPDAAPAAAQVLPTASPAGAAGVQPRVVRPSTPLIAPPTSPAHAHSSNVECVREGDRITRLIVTCGCGERIEIDCLYGSRA